MSQQELSHDPCAHPQLRTFTAFKGDDPRAAQDNGLSSDDEADVSSILSLSRRKRRRTMAQAPHPSHSSYASTGVPVTGHPNGYGRRPSIPHSTRIPYSPVMPSASFGSGPDGDLDDENTAEAEEEHRAMMRRRRSVALPESDRVARQRCYDYLLMAIDAVWAQYCDSTSYAESQMYQCTPASPSSEIEDPIMMQLPGSPTSPREPVSMQPHSRRLMRLKKRLLDAKYALTEIVGNDDPDSSSRFWKTWDVLKHEVVEQVEGDDDDDVHGVVEDLEEGRY